MSTAVETLLAFIKAAEKSRKYPNGTASGRRSALKMFAGELNDDEKESIELIVQNLDQISNNVFKKNQHKMSANSLQTYKNRISALIADYQKYGTDPAKMASWSPQLRDTSKRGGKVGKIEGNDQLSNTNGIEGIDAVAKEMSRHELSLRPGVKAILVVPSDITKAEVDKIKKLTDFLESIAS